MNNDRPQTAADRPQTATEGRRPAANRRDEDYDRRGDRPEPSPTVGRVTVPEAAEILGTTTDAVRSRMRRGKLGREEGEDGTVYVILEGSEAGRAIDGRGTVAGGRETVNPTGTDGRESAGDGRKTVEDAPPVVEVLQDQVEHLRSELALERESSSELRRIIAAMTQRVPLVELEAPSEPRDASETVSEDTAKGNVHPVSQEPAARRSWWRRFFGFE